MMNYNSIEISDNCYQLFQNLVCYDCDGEVVRLIIQFFLSKLIKDLNF